MSWEAFRWTAKSPSELYHVLGPHGVDDLVRQMIAAVWRDLPAEGRTFEGAVQASRQVFDLPFKGLDEIPESRSILSGLHLQARKTG